MDYDTWLMNQVEEFMRECEPKLDGDGDAVNCIECENDECEHYIENHPINDYFEPDRLAEMQEDILWEV